MTQLPDETTIFGAQNHFKINMLGVNKKNEKNEKTVSSMFRRVFGQLTPLARTGQEISKNSKSEKISVFHKNSSSVLPLRGFLKSKNPLKGKTLEEIFVNFGKIENLLILAR